MFNKKKLYEIYHKSSIVLLIITTIMMILEYFKVINDNYSSRIIFFLVSISLFSRGVSKFKEKKAWSIFLILLSITSLIVLVLGIY